MSDNKLNKYVKKYDNAEDEAAQLYVEFQKVFVKLNSILRTNEEGIITLEDGVPGYFDLMEGDTAYFCFNNDPDINPRQVVKIATSKIYGRTLLYCSDISKKPNKLSASIVIDQFKGKFQPDLQVKQRSDWVYVAVHAQSETKGTLTLKYYNKKRKLANQQTPNNPSDKLSLFFANKKLSMKDIIEDLKTNQVKRSDFLDQLHQLINERKRRAQDQQRSNFRKMIELNLLDKSETQEQKQNYFNNQKEKRVLALQRKQVHDQTQHNMIILKHHRNQIKKSVQREVVQILQAKQQARDFVKHWMILRITQQAMNKLNSRFYKFKTIFIKELTQFFMARRIQRHFRKYINKVQNGHLTSLRPIYAGYLRNTFFLLDAVMNKEPTKKSKNLIYEFCSLHLGAKHLMNKMRKFYIISEKLKKRFQNTISRRKHKYRVMYEYWTSISDTCYFLKKNKNSSIIKKFNGQVNQEIKMIQNKVQKQIMGLLASNYNKSKNKSSIKTTLMNQFQKQSYQYQLENNIDVTPVNLLSRLEKKQVSTEEDKNNTDDEDVNTSPIGKNTSRQN
eukprot:403344125